MNIEEIQINENDSPEMISMKKEMIEMRERMEKVKKDQEFFESEKIRLEKLLDKLSILPKSEREKSDNVRIDSIIYLISGLNKVSEVLEILSQKNKKKRGRKRSGESVRCIDISPNVINRFLEERNNSDRKLKGVYSICKDLNKEFKGESGGENPLYSHLKDIEKGSLQEIHGRNDKFVESSFEGRMIKGSKSFKNPNEWESNEEYSNRLKKKKIKKDRIEELIQLNPIPNS